MTLSQLRDRLLVLSNKRDDCQKRIESLTAKHQESVSMDETLLQLQRLVQEASQITLETISIKINNIVTNALKAVFPNPYEFDLGFKISYGKLATDMRLVRDNKVYDMREDNGDGVVDCVALALRVAVLCLDKRNLRRLLILDEPMGALSVNYQALAGKMLKHLSEALNIQIVMIAAHGSNLEIEGAKVFNSADFGDGVIL